MPLLETKGAGSAQGFGLSLGSAEAVYIEDVFSTFLYAGSATAQTITNGIDLSTEGGLVWTKARTTTYSHFLTDTVRGANKQLSSNNTNSSVTSSPAEISSFNTDGYTLEGATVQNNAGFNFVGWTFRKQPKFFDVVTWTGDGAGGFRTLNHSLGAEPGLIIVKSTSIGQNWYVYHRSAGTNKVLYLNTTAAEQSVDPGENAWATTSTTFSINNTQLGGNTNGATYVAYLFAHNAGGFGLEGTDDVISCGSFTTDGSGNATVTLGYEPQLVLMKYSSQSSDWMILDNMRGFRVTGNASPGNNGLFPNLSNAESTSNGTISTYVDPTATGFIPIGFGPSKTIIYIAIRRGPMKVPTSGTEVFSPYTATNPGNAVVTTGFPVDLQIQKGVDFSGDIRLVDRLRGVSTTPTSPSSAFPFLVSNSTSAETTGTGTTLNWNNTGFTVGNTYTTGKTWAVNFRRAPGFFDEVCYTGTGANLTLTHNLGVAPELIIIKNRVSIIGWDVDALFTGAGYIRATGLNNTSQFYSQVYPDTIVSQPTATQFVVSSNVYVGQSNNTYVAYLFATLAGVSKVGSYTGTGTTQVINCGFTAGARFVLVKRTDSTGDWYVWDSARGIVAGNDPYLLLNSTAAEVTSTDYVDTASTGFEISSTAPAAINANGGSFIFLAIA